jgi:two-component system LytT family sensor kinase
MGEHGRSMLAGQRALWVAAASFWGFVAAISVAQTVWIAQTPGQRVDVRGAITWQCAYFLAWIPFTIAVWHVTRGWLPDRYSGWSGFLIRHVPTFAAVWVGHSLLVTLLGLAFGNQTVSIWSGFVRQLRVQVTAQLLIYTAVAGTGTAMAIYDRYRDRQVAAVRLQAELAAARLEALRGHLQPHFLFNSLHSVAALARVGDTDGVVRLVESLSDLLRHVLAVRDGHGTLREEMQIVERYVEIQRVRFADRLSVSVHLAQEAAHARVPLLVVQPLVENAVRHGVTPQVRGGTVMVRAVRDEGKIRIDVEDTGAGLPPGWNLHQATGTGLRNLASRLMAEFGTNASLEVRPRQGGGTRASVTLPFITS